MGDQIDMFETPKRGRGRPKGDRPALTGAQRMQRLREQARTVLNAPEIERDGKTLASLSDTALCELVRGPLRVGHPLAMAEIITELMDRTNARRANGCPRVDLARWLEPSGDWYQITHGDGNQDSDLRTVTTIQEDRSGDDSRTVTVNDGQDAAGDAPGKKRTGRGAAKEVEYSIDAKAIAVRMMRQPNPKLGEIRAALVAHCGRAPHKMRDMKKWMVDPAVVALLDGDGQGGV